MKNIDIRWGEYCGNIKYYYNYNLNSIEFVQLNLNYNEQHSIVVLFKREGVSIAFCIDDTIETKEKIVLLGKVNTISKSANLIWSAMLFKGWKNEKEAEKYVKNAFQPILGE